MREVLEADADGMVHAPVKSGLGYEVDWDVIDNETVNEFS
jgi:L-alanine-DL-glutamate epimerase-like enolase superfamily enzyme